jgi:hypothetical protein
MKQPKTKDQSLSATSSKRAYSRPKLETFGPVKGLTLGSGGSKGDGRLGMTRRG